MHRVLTRSSLGNVVKRNTFRASAQPTGGSTQQPTPEAPKSDKPKYDENASTMTRLQAFWEDREQKIAEVAAKRKRGEAVDESFLNELPPVKPGGFLDKTVMQFLRNVRDMRLHAEEDKVAIKSNIKEARVHQDKYDKMMGYTPSAGVSAPIFQSSHPHHHVEVTEEVPDVLYGAFGTTTNPVIVRSAFDERIVGCLGRTNDDQHQLIWHNVNSSKPTICLECGQVFKLKNVGIHDGHGHGHGDAHEAHGHADAHAHGHEAPAAGAAPTSNAHKSAAH